MRQDDGSELFKLRFIRERYGASIRASAARHNMLREPSSPSILEVSIRPTHTVDLLPGRSLP